MKQRLVIVGAGFAGMYAALSASRLREQTNGPARDLEIVLVSQKPELVIRPRLYEPNPERMTAPLGDVLDAIEATYVQGEVEGVDTDTKSIEIREAAGVRRSLTYDRLVITTGSRLFRPPIPGLQEHGFSVDQLEDAIELDRHLKSLSSRAATSGRDTVVVAGGGFTGIEVATEMPARLRRVLGNGSGRVVLVERNPAVVPDMGPGPRPIVEDALRTLGIETRLGVGVTALDRGGVTLSDGERIDSDTVIWAAGIRAAPLTAKLPAERDNFGRLLVDRELRVPGLEGIFAAGDAAKASCDDIGNHALMSCQHATRLGAFAGNNAAADLLGLPLHPYHQEAYVVCLDLGEAGAVFTRGWDRQVKLVGAEAKAYKTEINTLWIYPPPAERGAALASADPEQVTRL
ncbi:NAD(P)/FAD-dependent oxidoreductase [Enterovirga sp. CN4-39]|uniref:NAD(P)/FAD-dependent oxidoreductase n=1 Tax=Enterovirga sp. CN4-39 TaxID=3400910 RepID=UPI003BFE5073